MLRPKFITLILLTLLTAALLSPFVFSGVYMPLLREQNFAVYEFFRSDLYKQVTGFVVLAFVLIEMGLTLRKRGRPWKIKLPGKIFAWRSVHIFAGVALVGMVLIHTIGATGLNFNAAFLWLFFAVSLSALVGVGVETGVVESNLKYISLVPLNSPLVQQWFPPMAKALFIRNLRGIWLSTHMFLVVLFFIMLGFHIFLAYYYQ
jgi:hypothetical protein